MLLYVLTAVSYIAVLPVAQYDWAGSGQNAAVILFLAPQRGGRGTPLPVALGKKFSLIFRDQKGSKQCLLGKEMHTPFFAQYTQRKLKKSVVF